MLLFRVWLRRFANARLRKQIEQADLRVKKLAMELDSVNAQLKFKLAYIEMQDDVIARERARVSAETQLLARTEADAKNGVRTR